MVNRLHGQNLKVGVTSGLATMRPEPERPGRLVLETMHWPVSANAESPIFVLRTDVLLNLLSGQG
jgi:hypothetical protein